MGLHEILVLVHGFYPSALTKELKEYSDRVKQLVHPNNVDLGELNRLRLLVKTFKSVRGCSKFSPLCEKCGHKVSSDEKVAEVRSCRPSCGGTLDFSESQNHECSICTTATVGSMLKCTQCRLQFCEACVLSMGDMFEAGCTHQLAKLCSCGESMRSHPWSKNVISECFCGTNKQCVLFVLKTFLAHDGLAETLRLINSTSTQVQRYSFALLWLLCEPSESSLLRCRGGSRFIVNIEPSEKNKKEEFILVVSTPTLPHKTRRKITQMIQFAETMRSLLKGFVDLPEMPKNKSKAGKADLVKIHLSIVLGLLSIPESYYKVIDNPQAKALLCELLDVNESLLKVRRDIWTKCVTDCIQSHRARGTLPRWMVHLLAQLFGGNLADPCVDIWDKAQDEPEPKFAISGDNIAEDSLLPLILLAVPAAPDALMVALLENLNAALVQPRTWSFIAEKFQMWFLPLLLDHYGSGVSSTCLQLCIEVLSSILVHHTLLYTSAPESKHDTAEPTPDSLFSTTIALIGSENGARALPWPKRHAENVLALGHSVATKLAAAYSLFQESIEHPVWANIFPVLDVFRNMTWCPMSSGTNELIIQHLLSKPLKATRDLVQTNAVTLLSERTIAALRTLLLRLKLFDSFAMDTSLPIGSRSRAIKGPGLAYLGYFRDCFSCFKSAASEDQYAMLGLFYGSYHFELPCSKEEEARLKLVNFVDVSHQETAEQPATLSGQDAQDWQHSRDLESMRAGILVWNTSGSKIQQCYLHIERQAVLGMLSTRGNTLIENNLSQEVMAALVSPSSPANHYALVLDSKDKKLALPLFEQVTLEFSGDMKALGKHGLDFVEYLGITMVAKKQRIPLLCNSVSDLECLDRVYPRLRKGNLAKSPPPPPPKPQSELEVKVDGVVAKQTKIDLRTLISQVHRFCATTLSLDMWEFSEKVHETVENNQELGDLNRLNFLVHIWQSKKGCATFLTPCEKCGKSKGQHKWQKHRATCTGVMQVSPSPGAICSSCRIPAQKDMKTTECKECGVIFCADCQECQQFIMSRITSCALCGKLTDSHPWQQLAVGSCWCGTDGECHLITVKTFLAYGGVTCLERLACESTSLRSRIQRCCVHLLGFLSSIPQSSFMRCWGGTFAQVSVTVTDKDLLLSVGANSSQTNLIKKLSVLNDFQERMAEILTGVNLPKARGQVDAADVASSSTALFDVLQVPENFRKMYRVSEAREQFNSFLELDITSSKLQVTKEVLTQFTSSVAQAYSKQRDLPFAFLFALTQLMSGDQMDPWKEIIADLNALPPEGEQEFSIVKVTDFWILSLMLLALPTTSDDVATSLLRELTHFFLSHSQQTGFKDEPFQKWFLPLVFDYASASKDDSIGEPVSPSQYVRMGSNSVKTSGTPTEIFNLLVNLMCMFQLQLLLSFSRAGQADRGVEVFAATIAQIAAYKFLNESPLSSWGKRNVEVIHIFAAAFVGKLNSLVTGFRNDVDHYNWDLMYGMLNIYRNMTWCPSDRIQTHLLSKHESQFLPITNLLQGSDSTKSTAPSIALLTEPLVSNLVNLLVELKLSNVEVKQEASPEDVVRSKFIKGTGLAFTTYFTHCNNVFQAVKTASLADQQNVISQFFGAYKFDASYSKINDTSYTLEKAPQTRRRSLGKLKGATNDEQEAKRRHLRDLGTLSVGINVWQVDVKGSKIKQRIAALKSEGVASELNEEKSPLAKMGSAHQLLPGRRSANATEGYSLVIESKGSKSSLKLFEQATLEPTCDAKILAKHNLEYASHLGMTLFKGPKPISYLICTSVEDFECWERVLRTLNERYLAVEEQRLEAGRPTIMFNDLQTLFNLVHQCSATPSTLALMETSKNMQVLANPPLEELNRIRLLLHAWQDNSSFVCVCNADDRSASVDGSGPMYCQVLGIKSFLSYGLVGHLTRLLQHTSTPLDLACLKESVWLLGVLSTLSDEGFARCWGGAPVRVKVEIQSKEITLAIDGNIVRFSLTKKMSLAKTFLTNMIDVLTTNNIIKLPKNITDFRGDAGMKTALQDLFDLLSIPENYLKLIRSQKARMLFLTFLDLEHNKNIMFSNDAFAQCINELISNNSSSNNSSNNKRNLPSAVLHALVALSISEDLQPFSALFVDPDVVLNNMNTEVFSIPIIKDFSFLPYVLQALCATQEDISVCCLQELKNCFNKQTQLRSKLVMENIPIFFLPVLFEHFDIYTTNVVTVASSPTSSPTIATTITPTSQQQQGDKGGDIFQLSLDILASSFSHYLLNSHANNNNNGAGGDEYIRAVASFLVFIGTYAVSEGSTSLWPIKNVRIIHLFIIEILNKFIQAIPIFRNRKKHYAEIMFSLFEYLNICRNMSWCPVGSTQENFIRYLLTPPVSSSSSSSSVASSVASSALSSLSSSLHTNNLNLGNNKASFSQGFSLLNEAIIEKILVLLESLQLFSLDFLHDAQQIRNVKGAGFAYLNYFRECAMILNPEKGLEGEMLYGKNSSNSITQFFQSYKFDISYSKEVEERLSSLTSSSDSALISPSSSSSRKMVGEKKEFVMQTIPSLQELITHMRDFCPTSLNEFLWEQSENLQQNKTSHNNSSNSNNKDDSSDNTNHKTARDSTSNKDYLRLVAIRKMFQGKYGCNVFTSPCQMCGKAADTHPWQRTVCPSSSCLGKLTHIACLQEPAPCSSCTSIIVAEKEAYGCIKCFRKVCQECVREYGCQRFVSSHFLPSPSFSSSSFNAALANTITSSSSSSPSSSSSLCICGKEQSEHPWTQHAGVCQCGQQHTQQHQHMDSSSSSNNSNGACILFSMKTMLAHGGASCLRKLLLTECTSASSAFSSFSLSSSSFAASSSPTVPFSPFAASSSSNTPSSASSSFPVQLESLRLLILLSTLAEKNFMRCWGGATISVNVEHINVKVGLITHTEIVLVVLANLTTTRLQKTLAMCQHFDSKMRKLLEGVVSFPSLTSSNNNSTTTSLLPSSFPSPSFSSSSSSSDVLSIETSISSLFSCLYLPENFHRMYRVTEARILFEEFLELDCRSLQITKEYVQRCVEKYARIHMNEKNLPRSLFLMLIEMMSMHPLKQSYSSSKKSKRKSQESSSGSSSSSSSGSSSSSSSGSSCSSSSGSSCSSSSSSGSRTSNRSNSRTSRSNSRSGSSSSSSSSSSSEEAKKPKLFVVIDEHVGIEEKVEEDEEGEENNSSNNNTHNNSNNNSSNNTQQKFAIHVSEVWMLPLLFWCIPAASTEIACEMLRAISDVFVNHPKVATEFISLENKFQLCFLPLFFCDERPEVFALAADIFAFLHVNYFLSSATSATSSSSSSTPRLFSPSPSSGSSSPFAFAASSASSLFSSSPSGSSLASLSSSSVSTEGASLLSSTIIILGTYTNFEAAEEEEEEEEEEEKRKGNNDNSNSNSNDSSGGNGRNNACWSKKHIEVIQSIVSVIASMYAEKLCMFSIKNAQNIWLASFEVWNVYRNMTWLPLDTKEREKEKGAGGGGGVYEYLLSRPALSRRNLTQEQGFSLMSFDLAKVLKEAMQTLKVFDFEETAENSINSSNNNGSSSSSSNSNSNSSSSSSSNNETARLNGVRGWGLALMSYFWDLYGCFRKELSSSQQLCMLAVFYGTFVFDPSFSKMEEARLRVLDDTEKRGVDIDEEDRKIYDLDVLAAGISAWQVPAKRGGKMQQCYLSIVMHTSSPRAGNKKFRNLSTLFLGSTTKVSTNAASIEYDLILEFKRKKTVYKLFDLEVRLQDCQSLSLNSIEFASSTSLVFIHQKKRIELVCPHSEEFEVLCRLVESQTANFRTGKGGGEGGEAGGEEENDNTNNPITPASRSSADTSGRFLFPLRRAGSSGLLPPPPPPLPLEITLSTTIEED